MRRLRRALEHPLSPFKRRTLYSLLVLIAVLSVGTEGMHELEGWSYIDSFYFMSLIATTQGPSTSPHTYYGKLFASVMAFISVGTALSAAAFIFGPFWGTLVKIGIDHVEAKKRRAERRR